MTPPVPAPAPPVLPPVRSAVIALGSNLGDSRDILAGAAGAVAGLAGVRLTALSPVYETAPVGGPAQPDYLNAVLLAEISLPSVTLLDRLHEIEAGFDRVRLVRWGPRTLDLDIITVAGERSDAPELTLPHPRAHERAFVLAPWHDADSGAVLPGYGPVAVLLADLDQSGIRRSPVPLEMTLDGPLAVPLDGPLAVPVDGALPVPPKRPEAGS